MFYLFLLVLHLVTRYIGTHIPTKSLNDGRKIPIIALGTYVQNIDIGKVREIINWAVKMGYRHIDTAAMYNNEDRIGQGLKDVIELRNLVNRAELFITSKLSGDKHARNQVVPALRESLARLGLTYVDLYLIHSPQSTNLLHYCRALINRPNLWCLWCQLPKGWRRTAMDRQMWRELEEAYVARQPDLNNIDYLETWKGMEDAKNLGLAKSIGVSNFNSEQINRLYTNSKTAPAVNQIEVNPTMTRESLVDICQSLGITVMAYSPLGYMVNRDQPNAPPPTIHDPTLTMIAQKYRKTTLQVVIRYLIDRNIVPIPRSTMKIHLRQNLEVFDFTLTPQEVAMINKFNRNQSLYGWL